MVALYYHIIFLLDLNILKRPEVGLRGVIWCLKMPVINKLN